MGKLLFTVGSSTRGWDEFSRILSENEIRLLIDVRRFPKSKLEHFRRQNLEPLLKSACIDYVWLGEGLGGFREGGYDAYTITPPFKEALGRLESLAIERRAAIMCCEKGYRACHRRFIAAALELRGWETIHLP